MIFYGLFAGLISAASPSFASTWMASNDKGLRIYTIGNGGTGKLTLVCDPENLWAAPEQGLKAEYHVFIQKNDRALDARNVTIITADYEHSFPLYGDAILDDNKPRWNELVRILQKPGTITVLFGDERFSATNDAPLQTECIRPLDK